MFLSASPAPDSAEAIVTEEGTIHYGTLRRAVIEARPDLPAKSVIWLLAGNSPAALIAYLTALENGHAVLPLAPDTPPARLKILAEAHRPDLVMAEKDSLLAALGPGERMELAGLPAWRSPFPAPPPHPDLALLLSTSGSTGSPKLVRLSRAAVLANAHQIIQALAVTPDERAIAHLPLAYSFGLSVLNSHLLAGASLVVTARSVLERPFWDLARNARATVFPGVPYHYDSLRRLGLDKLDAPELNCFLQAGGRMAPALVEHFARQVESRRGRFHVMYGQTEAAPRMAVLPAADASRKPGSVGLPLPGGRFVIEDGEVIYHGPNVMMGYAESRDDLTRGDEMNGRLPTGDLGHLDEEGYLFITGRRKRFAKLFGLRLDLAEVERLAESLAPVIAVEGKGKLVLFTTAQQPDIHASLRKIVAEGTGVHPGSVTVRAIDEVPRLPSGKPDLAALEAQA